MHSIIVEKIIYDYVYSMEVVASPYSLSVDFLGHIRECHNLCDELIHSLSLMLSQKQFLRASILPVTLEEGREVNTGQNTDTLLAHILSGLLVGCDLEEAENIQTEHIARES